MNKLKLFGAAAILAAVVGTPALAQGHRSGGMAMGGGGHSFSGGSAMHSSGNFGTSGFAGPSRNVAQGSWQGGERHEGWRGGRRGWGGPGLAFGLGYGYPYGYDSYAYYGGDCYLVRRRVLTPFGWRIRRVQVCD